MVLDVENLEDKVIKPGEVLSIEDDVIDYLNEVLENLADKVLIEPDEVLDIKDEVEDEVEDDVLYFEGGPSLWIATLTDYS